MPKISVLMPVYNTNAEYLKETIESVLDQTYKDFEFLIFDDGSDNEETIKTLKDFQNKDTRIKIIFSKHIGVSAARNKLFDMTQGEYCAIVDSDDICLKRRFEKQIKFLDNNPCVSVLGSWFETFPEKEIIKHPLKLKYFDIMKGCYIGHPTIMFRKSDFQKYNLKYNETLEAAIDYELWSRAIKFLNFANIQEVLVKYRVHSNNISHTKFNIQMENALKAQQNMLDFLTDNKSLQKAILREVQNSDKPVYKFIEKIFSIKNSYERGIKRKVITLFAVKLKLKIPNTK